MRVSDRNSLLSFLFNLVFYFFLLAFKPFSLVLQDLIEVPLSSFVMGFHYRFEGTAFEVLILVGFEFLLDLLLLVEVEVVLASQKFLLA